MSEKAQPPGGAGLATGVVVPATGGANSSPTGVEGLPQGRLGPVVAEPVVKRGGPRLNMKKMAEDLEKALEELAICHDAFNYDARGIPDWHSPGISAQVLWKANMAGSLASYRVRAVIERVLSSLQKK